MVHDRTPFSAQTVPKKPSVKYWHWFFPLMLLASIGLHGVVLFMPVAPSEDELVPPPDPEEDGIAITKIEAPQPRSPAAASSAPANPGTVKTARPAPTTAAAQTPSAGASRPSPAPTSPHRTGTRSTTQERSPTVTARTQNRQDAQTSQPTVPDLSTVGAVPNPNATAPTVPPTPDNGRENAVSSTSAFEAYIKVFEAYNGVTISEAEATSLRQSWLASFRDRGAAFANLEIQPLKDFDPLPYEANICLPSPPATAQVLVLVDAEGNVDEYQPFIQRTGYRNFDGEASQQIANHGFPDAETPQAYLAEIPVAYDPEDCEWPPNVDKLPDDYFTVLESYIGPTLTTPSEVEAAEVGWLTALKETEELELPHADGELTAAVFEDVETKVEYPLAICLPIAPKDSQWGVVVNPDGRLNGDPHPLRSTGYQNFDDRAQALVKNMAFPETGAPQIYVVEIAVDYNPVNCQELDSDSFDVPTTASGEQNTAGEHNGESVPEAAATATVAFDPAQQTRLVEQGRQQVEADSVGSLNASPDLAAVAIESGWSADIDQSCFLADLTPEQGPVPVAAAADALVLSESFDFVPLTVSRLYGTEVEDAGEYCGAPLLQLAVGGTPQLFASTVGFGAGNANALVVIWPTDPRESQD
jgi:hypothetical protein